MRLRTLLVVLALVATAVLTPAHFNNPVNPHTQNQGQDHGTGAINMQCGGLRVRVEVIPEPTPGFSDIGTVRIRVRDFDTGTWYGVTWSNVQLAGGRTFVYQSSRDDVSAVEAYLDNAWSTRDSYMRRLCHS